jgi:GntR family transcriptional regulator
MNDAEADPRAYIKLAVAVRRQITSGKLPPGAPVPSITVLAEEFSYSRGTCRKALQLLESEHLLIRYPGLGYFVRSSLAKQTDA